MRILLINPPASDKNLIQEYAPEELKAHLSRITLVGPPHSLCSLAGNLNDFIVDIFDLKAEYRLGLNSTQSEAVINKLEDFKPDIVGITVLTSEYNASIFILRVIKEYNKNILTIVGGIHPTLCPGDFHLSCIDIIMLGHGKKIFRDIVIAHIFKQGFSHIPNIGVQVTGQFFYTERENLFSSPEKLLSHIPANRELISRYEDAYRVSSEKITYGFIETSLGCPSKCLFCSIWPGNRGHYYKREIKDILNELSTMTDYQLIRLADANTTADIPHITRFFEEVKRKGFQNEFMFDMRADTAVNHPEVVEKAVEAGLRLVIIGIESINEEELKKYNKDSSLEINLKAIEILQRYGVHVRASFMIRPEYSDEDFFAIKDFIRENGLNFAAFAIMTPVPGTPLYKQYKDQIVIKDLDYYNFFNCVLPTKLPLKDFYGHIARLYSKQEMVT